MEQKRWQAIAFDPNEILSYTLADTHTPALDESKAVEHVHARVQDTALYISPPIHAGEQAFALNRLPMGPLCFRDRSTSATYLLCKYLKSDSQIQNNFVFNSNQAQIYPVTVANAQTHELFEARAVNKLCSIPRSLSKMVCTSNSFELGTVSSKSNQDSLLIQIAWATTKQRIIHIDDDYLCINLSRNVPHEIPVLANHAANRILLIADGEIRKISSLLERKNKEKRLFQNDSITFRFGPDLFSISSSHHPLCFYGNTRNEIFFCREQDATNGYAHWLKFVYVVFDDGMEDQVRNFDQMMMNVLRAQHSSNAQIKPEVRKSTNDEK